MFPRWISQILYIKSRYGIKATSKSLEYLRASVQFQGLTPTFVCVSQYLQDFSYLQEESLFLDPPGIVWVIYKQNAVPFHSNETRLRPTAFFPRLSIRKIIHKSSDLGKEKTYSLHVNTPQ